MRTSFRLRASSVMTCSRAALALACWSTTLVKPAPEVTVNFMALAPSMLQGSPAPKRNRCGANEAPLAGAGDLGARLRLNDAPLSLFLEERGCASVFRAG